MARETRLKKEARQFVAETTVRAWAQVNAYWQFLRQTKCTPEDRTLWIIQDNILRLRDYFESVPGGAAAAQIYHDAWLPMFRVHDRHA